MLCTKGTYVKHLYNKMALSHKIYKKALISQKNREIIMTFVLMSQH